MLLGARSSLIVILGVLIAACAAGPKARLCLDTGEPSTEPPFELTVTLSATELAVGDRVQVTYHLRNISQNPAAACPDGWDEFHVINIATKANRGLLYASTAIDTNSAIRLPPQATLTWVREAQIPDVGVGEAQFLGRFASACGPWTGGLYSQPVTIQIVAKRTDAN